MKLNIQNKTTSALRKTAVMTLLALVAMPCVSAMAASTDNTVNISNPLNVLAGSSVSTSTTGAGGFASSVLTDNLASATGFDGGKFFFDTSDTDQRISLSGFTPSAFTTVRIFLPEPGVDSSRNLYDITLRSSTSIVTTLNAGDYSTLLGTSVTGSRSYTAYSGTKYDYFDVTVAAPAGTQSLFIDAGPAAPGLGSRLYEVQALAVPEPSTMAFLALGLTAVVTSRRRRNTI